MTTLYVMCGPSGSGKSTYVEENLRNCIIVSTDKIRRELWGNEEDQQNPQIVFDIAFGRIKKHLSLEQDVVFDAMNLKSKDRKKVLKIAASYNIKKVVIVMATSLRECLAAQDNRDRHVPDDIVRAQYKKFEYPMLGEGWDEIRIIERL